MRAKSDSPWLPAAFFTGVLALFLIPECIARLQAAAGDSVPAWLLPGVWIVGAIAGLVGAALLVLVQAGFYAVLTAAVVGPLFLLWAAVDHGSHALRMLQGRAGLAWSGRHTGKRERSRELRRLSHLRNLLWIAFDRGAPSPELAADRFSEAHQALLGLDATVVDAREGRTPIAEAMGAAREVGKLLQAYLRSGQEADVLSIAERRHGPYGRGATFGRPRVHRD